MSVRCRVPDQLYRRVREDLARPHEFAAERVGFLWARLGNRVGDERLVLFRGYHAVPDDQYIDDPRSGARIKSTDILEAMQRFLDSGD